MCSRSSILVILLCLLGIIGIGSCGYQPIFSGVGVQDGLASYYGDQFQGRKTSNGEVFDNARFTAAHRTYPFGTRVRVTNLESEQAVEVRINDRGPVKPERVIDLTRAAARAIGIERKGIGRVRIEVVEWGSSTARR